MRRRVAKHLHLSPGNEKRSKPHRWALQVKNAVVSFISPPSDSQRAPCGVVLSVEHCLSSADETLLSILNEKAFKLIGVEWMNSGPLCDLYMIPLMAWCHG